MAIFQNKKDDKEYRRTYWNIVHKKVPSNVKALLWILFIWSVLVHGDLLRRLWGILAPIVSWSGLMEGPFKPEHSFDRMHGMADL
ncbi:hypothetical protein EB796_009143 [Bugula neritina]|uniref:Uncharacterized protein n=1 Tax=Bugula neritina TaxID=10212 RepID=A0A7J7K1M4_BUGNE|nr:hypothetical protein EB796_009143 [Bugula neritina]